MDNKSMAVEIGQRCRRFRNALGISQHKLADMVGTTPQNISKYEKEGIHDIDIIRYLSSALGHDLMTDEVDEEGSIGEIGKEILTILVESKKLFLDEGGKVEASKLLDGSLLFGLPQERVIKEIFKLEKIGLCVREQYIDFYNKEHDVIFITAKGVITLKHIGGLKNEVEDYKNVKTYEMVCEGHESYQAYIDSEPAEKIIRNLSVKNGFRVNYICFLKKAYDAQNDFLGYLKNYYIGKTAYVDIVFSMIMEITREKADYMIKLFDENCSEEAQAEFDYLCDQVYEGQYNNLIYELKKYIDYDMLDMHMDCDEWLDEINCNEDTSEKYEKIQKNIPADAELEHLINNSVNHLTETFTSKLEEHGGENPLYWYSKDEIETFIKKNILGANSEYEEEIEQQLLRINEMVPNLVSAYFDFPTEWEENGLADLVRNLYKVSK